MHDYNFLIALAIILLSTKFLGLLTEKIHFPQIVGALIAGILIGPSGLGLVGETDLIVKISSIGVIILMFLAGIETDLNELKSVGKASAIIAICGVVLPLVTGAIIYFSFYEGFENLDKIEILKGFFVGVVLTATSVSVTIETLKELGFLKGRMGSAIVGAAIIDDVIGIIALTIISSFASPDVRITKVIFSIIGYVVFIAVVGFIAHKFFEKIERKYYHSKRISVYAFVFCLLMAWTSEVVFGIADITGAYFAGLILCNIMEGREFIARKFEITSYMIFAPVFFASIGIKTDLSTLTSSIILFALVLTIGAILSKLIGCGLAAKFSGFNKQDSMAIGVGMVSRGEVALIVAQKGAALGMISASLFPAIILVVIITTLITPILLKFVLAKKKIG